MARACEKAVTREAPHNKNTGTDGKLADRQESNAYARSRPAEQFGAIEKRKGGGEAEARRDKRALGVSSQARKR